MNDSRNASVTQALEALFIDSFRLYVTLHGFHWNAQGPRFRMLHLMFEDQYREMWGALDEIAERLRILGRPAPGSVGAFAAAGSLPDRDGPMGARAMLQAALDGHAALAAQCRDALALPAMAQDAGSADLFTQRLLAHEKAGWMLGATLAEDVAA
jgi:starvation-inducible DNA-binding protein